VVEAISVIIPAFNEERYLPLTLEHLERARDHVGAGRNKQVEVVVVDNASTDGTADIAMGCGARVVPEPDHNIARVRNTGASAASGDLLVFLDADTLVPFCLLSRIIEVMEEPTCLGGAVDIDHRPTRRLIKIYLRAWRLIGLCLGMAQGAVQFCRREAFSSLGGYDERMYMGEDVDFYWRLARLAKTRKQHVQYLKDVRVVPSCRRFDQWPTSRILIETNPLYITLFRRRQAAWRGWYGDVPRRSCGRMIRERIHADSLLPERGLLADLAEELVISRRQMVSGSPVADLSSFVHYPPETSAMKPATKRWISAGGRL
jgi:glycosyltransferase involved in cell wall biosynthesis